MLWLHPGNNVDKGACLVWSTHSIYLSAERSFLPAQPQEEITFWKTVLGWPAMCVRRESMFTAHTHTPNLQHPRHNISSNLKKRRNNKRQMGKAWCTSPVAYKTTGNTELTIGEVRCLLPSGKRYRSIRCRTTRLQSSFFFLCCDTTQLILHTLTWSLAVMWFFYSLAFYIFVCSRGNYKLCFII